jgi:hypothetical protein
LGQAQILVNPHSDWKALTSQILFQTIASSEQVLNGEKAR